MNKNSDFLNIVIVLVIAAIIIYLGMIILNMNTKGMNMNTRMRAGLTNQGTSNGEAGNASNFAAAIKAQTVLLQDTLLISKYRSDYENVIINMDDYLSMLMLKQLLNIDTSKDLQSTITGLDAINTFSAAKKSLNETMAFLDKQ